MMTNRIRFKFNLQKRFVHEKLMSNKQSCDLDSCDRQKIHMHQDLNKLVKRFKHQIRFNSNDLQPMFPKTKFNWGI